jgi:hypothetical protein
MLTGGGGEGMGSGPEKTSRDKGRGREGRGFANTRLECVIRLRQVRLFLPVTVFLIFRRCYKNNVFKNILVA